MNSKNSRSLQRIRSVFNEASSHGLMTIVALLTAFAAVVYLSPLIVRPLHEDVVYVTHATWTLLTEGHLKNSGLCFAFQTLRPEFHSTQPFFAHYLAAVFYFLPFFKLFGTSDVVFYFAQAVLLVLLGICLAKSGLGWRWSVLTIAVGVVTKTLVGSIVLSPTQLLAITLMAYFWLRLEKMDSSHPIADGLLIAVSSVCRPEALFFGLLAVARIAWKEWESKKGIRFIGISVLSAVIFISLFGFARHFLGAASGYDNKLVLLMSDVLAPRFDVLGLDHFPPLSALIYDPVLRGAFLHKLFRQLSSAFSSSSLVWGRTEIVLAVLPFLLAGARIVRLRTYAPVFMLLAFQFVVNAALIPLARHYDAAFFFLLCALMRDAQRWSEQSKPNVQKRFQTIAVILSALVLAASLRFWSDNFQNNRQMRAAMLKASEEAHRRVPADAFVITDIPELWLWYGRGKMCCFVPLKHPTTMQSVLQKFPQAYMVMFLGDQRSGYPLAQFRRPLLSSAHHVMIYGPKKGIK